eukprot:7592932-Pyramimonas_sp.AAC.1
MLPDVYPSLEGKEEQTNNVRVTHKRPRSRSETSPRLPHWAAAPLPRGSAGARIALARQARGPIGHHQTLTRRHYRMHYLNRA